MISEALARVNPDKSFIADLRKSSTAVTLGWFEYSFIADNSQDESSI